MRWESQVIFLVSNKQPLDWILRVGTTLKLVLYVITPAKVNKNLWELEKAKNEVPPTGHWGKLLAFLKRIKYIVCQEQINELINGS